MTERIGASERGLQPAAPPRRPGNPGGLGRLGRAERHDGLTAAMAVHRSTTGGWLTRSASRPSAVSIEEAVGPNENRT
jgi:hypothetical protein